jgi:hypothetical protein
MEAIPRIPRERTCRCHEALREATL